MTRSTIAGSAGRSCTSRSAAAIRSASAPSPSSIVGDKRLADAADLRVERRAAGVLGERDDLALHVGRERVHELDEGGIGLRTERGEPHERHRIGSEIRAGELRERAGIPREALMAFFRTPADGCTQADCTRASARTSAPGPQGPELPENVRCVDRAGIEPNRIDARILHGAIPSRRPVARRPAGEKLVQGHDDRAIFQASPDELPVIDIHSL